MQKECSNKKSEQNKSGLELNFSWKSKCTSLNFDFDFSLSPKTILEVTIISFWALPKLRKIPRKNFLDKVREQALCDIHHQSTLIVLSKSMLFFFKLSRPFWEFIDKPDDIQAIFKIYHFEIQRRRLYVGLAFSWGICLFVSQLLKFFHQRWVTTHR